MKYYTKKEAANLLNISVRTLERYLKSSKNNVAPFVVLGEKGKTMISQNIIDKYNNVAPLSQSKAIEKDTKNILDKQIEKLEKDNERLNNLVAHKDKIIEEKDKIIEDGRQDFKILTSKIVEQNNTILQLQENKQEQPPKKDKEDTTPSNNLNDIREYNTTTLLPWFLGLIILILSIIITLFLIE